MAMFLLKTEPTDFSFADLQRAKKTVWDGVSNPVALKHLRSMQPGDPLIIYETGDQKSAVGTAKVVAVDTSDFRNPRVEIEAGKALRQAVPLSVIKADKVFSDSPLVRQGRLSVVPLTPAQYRALTEVLSVEF
jgi:predicted RNA-binding protein with PUA-like domain